MNERATNYINESGSVPSRIIHRSGDEDFLQRLLEAVCIAELIRPGKELWLFSAWISDFRILDNSRGAVANLVPDWPLDHIRLSQWLRYLAESGTIVRIKTNTDAKNELFGRKVETIAQGLPAGRIEMKRSESLHAKGMIGEGFYLRGSFNFTSNGVLILEEHGQFDTARDVVAQGRLEMATRWEDT